MSVGGRRGTGVLRTVAGVALAAMIATSAATSAAGTGALASRGGSVPRATGEVTTGQIGAPVPVLDWQPCGEGFEAYLCTTAEVPTDYDHPAGRTTGIALTLLPAGGDPAERVGTLFVNPGGPGGSGVDFVQQGGPQLFWDPQVLERFDILGFDPRGVGRSEPATCFRTAEQELTSPLFALRYPIDRRQEVRYTVASLALAARCQATSAVRLSTASTANVARDMDLLRQAVGDDRLSFVGYSYGTYLGATYARLFPDRVGRFVLDATVDPAAWSGTGTGDASPTTPFGVRTRQHLGVQETFAEFTRLCVAGGPTACPLAALGDPTTVVHETFDRLAADPVEVPLPDGTVVEITQQVAVGTTFDAMYFPSAWPGLAEFLAALAAPAPLADDVAAGAARTPSALGERLRGEDYASIGAIFASICVDVARTSPRLYPGAADRADEAARYFGRLIAWIGMPCEFWVIRDEDAFTGPWEQTTQAPVLVVGNRFDPATPYRQTEPYRDLFPGGHLLTLEGWGHTTLGKSRCVDAHVASYLVTGLPPADGSVCQPDVVPFAPATDARAVPRPDVPPGVPRGVPLW